MLEAAKAEELNMTITPSVVFILELYPAPLVARAALLNLHLDVQLSADLLQPFHRPPVSIEQPVVEP